ncbi:MAG TPA: alpha/beta hydrolase [Steroidobacteraceae bacterium]|jgi:acetyl esterase/lipase|nr:alpha/beta hydrolase [Steroidobacteraceae bacterium]
MKALPEERAGHAPPPSLQQRRQMMAAALRDGLWKTQPPPVELMLGGVRVLRFDPPESKRATVLHLHGGAFRQGCPEMVGAFAVALAARCGVEVICPAYRLAPEYPYPTGLRDALSVLRTLAAPSSASQTAPLIISGDSAGGGLAASLTRLAVDGGVPVAALVLLSAWLDLTLGSNSFDDNAASDPLFSREAAEEAVLLYLQGLSARQPEVSPLLGTVKGFPPSFISIGSGEVLADDGRRFHRALCEVGLRSQLHVVDGMEHVAVTRNLKLHGAAETFEALAGFIGALVGG